MISLTLGLSLLAGCGEGIQPLYDEHRAFALETAGAVKQGWKPDATLVLSDDVVSALLTAGLKDALGDAKPVEVARVATVTPKGEVKRVRLTTPKDACEGCLTFSATIQGDAAVVAGRLNREIPFTATIAASLAFTTKAEGDARVLYAEIKEIRRAEVELGSGSVPGVKLDDVMRDWSDKVLKEAKPMQVGVIGGADLMVRDMRVQPKGQGMEVQVLTQAAHGAAHTGRLPNVSAGWVAAVSEATLLDFARVEAFKQGEIDLDVHAEPLSLDVDGARFTMGMRLWRLNSPGWWRDYEVRGALGVSGKALSLAADEVVELGASEGAGLADPLALLGESFILDGIRDAAAGTFPSQQSAEVDGKRLVVTLTSATGQGDMLVLTGTAGVAREASGAGSASKGSSKKR